MNIFNIFKEVKEVNDKLITIEMENRQLKEKINEFSCGFKEVVDKLKERNHELELKHSKEMEALRSEISNLRNRFDVVTEQAILKAINENGVGETLTSTFLNRKNLIGDAKEPKDKHAS